MDLSVREIPPTGKSGISRRLAMNAEGEKKAPSDQPFHHQRSADGCVGAAAGADSIARA